MRTSETFILFLLAGALLGAGAQTADGYQELISIWEQLGRFEEPFSQDVAAAVKADSLKRMEVRLGQLATQLAALDAGSWDTSRKVDYWLVKARLNDLDFKLETVRPWARDPGFYVDAVRTVPHVDLPLSGADLSNFAERLKSVPVIVGQARQSLVAPAAELAGLALFHLEHYDGVGQGEPFRRQPPAGVIGWYEDLGPRVKAHHPELAGAAQSALESVKSFRDWLRSGLKSMSEPAWVGLEKYQWYLRHVRLLPYTVDDLRVIGERETARAALFLEIERNKNRGLPELSPKETRLEYESDVREAERRIRAFLRERDLLHVPEEMGPFETDAFWREGLKRHFWEELQYRDAHNNHIHASVPGHRFDILTARKIDHPIRSGSRDGGRIEGWAFYLEEMLLQAGLLDDRPRARELFYIAQLARAVRIPAELRMQSGKMNLAEAVDWMIQRVPFMEPNLARYDLEIYLRRPTYGMTYVMGKVQLEQLLSEVRFRRGEDFTLGRFHEEFLSCGLIPISLIRAEMLGWDEARFALR